MGIETYNGGENSGSNNNEWEEKLIPDESKAGWETLVDNEGSISEVSSENPDAPELGIELKSREAGFDAGMTPTEEQLAETLGHLGIDSGEGASDGSEKGRSPIKKEPKAE